QIPHDHRHLHSFPTRRSSDLMASAFSPSRQRFKVSLPKAEKVVNPPRTPMKISVRASAVKTPRVSESCERKPITKQPMRFTAKVDRKRTRLNSSHQIISYAVF